MSGTDGARSGRAPRAAGSPTVFLDAVLAWPHAGGVVLHTLVRGRAAAAPSQVLRWTVIASQLRDNPPGHDILGDFAGLATAVCTQLIGPAIDRASIDWFAHHGPFSSHDPTGPATLTRVVLRWNGALYLPHELADEQLLDPAATDRALNGWALDPVDEVLAAQRRTPPGANPDT